MADCIVCGEEIKRSKGHHSKNKLFCSWEHMVAFRSGGLIQCDDGVVPKDDFLALLEEHRSKLGWSQGALAKETGQNASNVNRICGGTRPYTRHIVEAFSDAFGLKGRERDRFFVAAGYASPEMKAMGTPRNLPYFLSCLLTTLSPEMAAALEWELRETTYKFCTTETPHEHPQPPLEAVQARGD